ncbi:MAG: ADP-glyceromanno-heptose 6-epimerase [Candidatus Omnitrophota bacterium]
MIIVTGAAGFIGSCITARLNDMGYDDLIVVDDLNENFSKKRNLEGKKFASYIDKEEFLATLENIPVPESVIHMGACSSTTGTDAEYYERNNFQYTKRLAQWCFDHKVPFIYASSASTYGDGRRGYDDDESRLDELEPLNLYGWSKHKFDLWVMENRLRDKVVGLKFFNVFGPNEYHKGEMRSVVNKAYPQVVKDGRINLFKSYRSEYADGEQKRDFIYIKDAVDVVMHFFEHPDIHGIYNVGTGKARSWNDLANAIFNAVGKKPDIHYIDMPEQLRERYQYYTQASMNKLRRIGFCKTFMSLEESVKDYAGYLKNGSYI